MEEQRARWLWYERTWFVIAALVVFWPIGLALMWVQKKFTPVVRVAVSVAAPALSALVIAGIVLLPRAGAPVDNRPAPVAETTASTSPTGSTSTTGSLAASSTTTTKTPASGKTKGKTKRTTRSKRRTTTTGATTPPQTNPQPVPVPVPHPSGNAVFTLVGNYTATHVHYSLSAAGVSGAAAYVWYVSAGGSSHTLVGQTVSYSYDYGMPPDSVTLTALRSDGSSIRSWQADVTASKSSLSAAAY